ncbi:MAG: Cytoplasmic copper homeostasis protein CutC [uncultured Paraburkholderia sp.]|nr:MAG: Cytoplasmic copper homeostasis protein CutC [uncultured Paraburkholderia sp.]CAH2806706.1 MAG: Cytoplasmic copper homeostasis protein CutC [uncultured Paraburkholderia sp.]CAH2902982.1 MAG: Cytoplasmic copper homeostasis protein CutC [uncultured Paraburkholderia sp.]CAH2940950.1 MAG: Cytoplasmic copper homeostasis protein CutC [uncultured Paraburkholderia sp.]CAH2942016.1 MAG: Cytoplasmic copper homeostasis protein CutC [uncultured Paraburkholderia sp.]
MSVLLEVIATTLADARLAAQAGADRLELITAMGEGGLTPSLGLIEAVVETASIPVNVIVRPHSRSFVYDADDYAVMLRDVRAVKAAGANGVVIGMLNAQGEIDREQLARAIDAADGLAITFHRAFDEVRDQRKALDVLLGFDAVTNVLTSGGKPSVLDAEAAIRDLVRQASGSHCTVLAGAGLTVDAVAGFVNRTQVQAVHFGSGVRVGGNGLAPVDIDKLARVRALLNAQ